MNRRDTILLVLFIVVPFSCLFVSLVWTRQFFFAAVFALMVGVPWLFANLLLWRDAVKRGQREGRFRKIICWGSLVLAPAAMLVGGHFWWVQREQDEAFAFPERIAPLLEQYRSEHGGYPERPDQIPTQPVLPLLLRSPGGYTGDGNQYSMMFSEPQEMLGFSNWRYASYDSKWHRLSD